MKRTLFRKVAGEPFKMLAFPCQAGLKRKLVYNVKEFAAVFNHVNKFSSDGMYNTVYAFDEIENGNRVVFNSARVDKIWTDIDLDDHGYDMLACYLSMLSTHLFLESEDLQHAIIFTANGYHVYIGADVSGIANDRKNDYLKSAVATIERVTGTRFCYCTEKAPVARITRTVGSFYAKHASKKDKTDPGRDQYMEWLKVRGLESRYCVSLSHDDIHSGYMEIYKKSLRPSFKTHIIGHYRILLRSLPRVERESCFVYDEEKINEIRSVDDETLKNVYAVLEKMFITIDDLPPCIRLMMKNKELNYHERYAFTTYLATLDLSPDAIKLVWKSVMSPSKYKHAMMTDSPEAMVARANHGMYNVGCATFKHLGYCDETCTLKNLYPFMNESE